jgi:hypothetical protein
VRLAAFYWGNKKTTAWSTRFERVENKTSSATRVSRRNILSTMRYIDPLTNRLVTENLFPLVDTTATDPTVYTSGANSSAVSSSPAGSAAPTNLSRPVVEVRAQMRKSIMIPPDSKANIKQRNRNYSYPSSKRKENAARRAEHHERRNCNIFHKS